MNELCYWLLRVDNQLLTIFNPAGDDVFPCGLPAEFAHPADSLLLGVWQGLPCYAAELDAIPEHFSGQPKPVRELFNLISEKAAALAGRATQLLDWQKNHRYCGHCGAATVQKTGEFSKVCPACQLIVYPRISPVVMVLIGRGDELLLARGAHFKPGVFSALAGFVEAGETLEQCAVREVQEEVGVEICNLRYFKSQSWPFPASLMVAFFADYAGGMITPDPVEIEAAGWFSCSALPALPAPASIARQLIEAYCATRDSHQDGRPEPACQR